MPTPKTVLARFILAAFSGLLFWSSWSWSIARKNGADSKAKLDLSRRLNDIALDPSKISAADINAVKTAWGKDASRMFELLRAAN